MSLTSEAKKEVQRLLQSGKKIHAVKYLHDTFNITLHDAKLLVEAVEGEKGSNLTPQSNKTAGQQTVLHGDLKERVIALLEANEKIEAIKLVKTELNIGLKEAMVMVEAIHRVTDPNYKPINAGKGCLSNVFILIGSIFGFIGLVFLVIAGSVYYFQEETIEKSIAVKGRVIDMRYSGSSAAPIFTYEFKGKHRTWQSTAYSNPPAYARNEEVEIYVNKDDPSDVIVNTFMDRWFLVGLFGFLGSIFSLVGVGLFYAGRKTQIV